MTTAVLAYSLWALIVEFQTFNQGGYLRRQHVRHLQRGVVEFDANKISGWMTFKYINLIFNLPPEYLKNELKITDKRYPDVSIVSLAKRQKQDSAEILQATIAAIKAHSANN